MHSISYIISTGSSEQDKFLPTLARHFVVSPANGPTNENSETFFLNARPVASRAITDEGVFRQAFGAITDPYKNLCLRMYLFFLIYYYAMTGIVIIFNSIGMTILELHLFIFRRLHSSYIILTQDYASVCCIRIFIIIIIGHNVK